MADENDWFPTIIVIGAYAIRDTDFVTEEPLDLAAAMMGLKKDAAIERGLLSGETAEIVSRELKNAKLKKDLMWAQNRADRNAESAEKFRENAAALHLQVVNLTKKLNNQKFQVEQDLEAQLNVVLKERDDAKREVEALKCGTPKLHEPQLNPDGTVCLCQHCLKVIRNCEGLYVHKDGKTYHGGCGVTVRAEELNREYEKIIAAKLHKRQCKDCGLVFYAVNGILCNPRCDECHSGNTSKLEQKDAGSG